MFKIAAVVLLLLFSNAAFAHLHLEKEYQKAWCDKAGGVTEFKNPDNTRIDCLTKKYAIEFDFAEKWAESVGQALYYGLMTGKKSGIVLISENSEKDIPYINRASVLSKKYKIKLWIMNSNEL